MVCPRSKLAHTNNNGTVPAHSLGKRLRSAKRTQVHQAGRNRPLKSVCWSTARPRIARSNDDVAAVTDGSGEPSTSKRAQVDWRRRAGSGGTALSKSDVANCRRDCKRADKYPTSSPRHSHASPTGAPEELAEYDAKVLASASISVCWIEKVSHSLPPICRTDCRDAPINSRRARRRVTATFAS